MVLYQETVPTIRALSCHRVAIKVISATHSKGATRNAPIGHKKGGIQIIILLFRLEDLLPIESFEWLFLVYSRVYEGLSEFKDLVNSFKETIN